MPGQTAGMDVDRAQIATESAAAGRATPVAEAAAPADPRLLTRPFLLLVSAQFLQAVGWASMLLLPLYLDHLGGSRAEIGAVMAAGAVGGLLLRPAIGWSLDTLGRKRTLVVGTLLAIAGMVLLVLVERIGPLIYADRVLYGIGEGTLFTGYFTFAADIIPAHRRTEGIALFGIAGLIPLALNPLVGEVRIEAADLRLLFPALSIFLVLSLLPLSRVPEPRQGEQRRRLRLREVFDALRHRRLASVWLATVVFATLLAVFLAFATVCAESRGVERPAALWLTYAGGAVTVRLLGARLPDRLGPSNLVAPAIGLYAAAALLAAAAQTTDDFLVVGLVAGLGHGYCFPVLTSQVVSRTPERLRGSGLAMFTALWALSALLLTPVFGHVADVWGDATMFALTAVLAAAALALWAIIEHRYGS